MVAFSRARMTSATSFGGALRYWLHAFCVSSCCSRAFQSGAAADQLVAIALSTTAGVMMTMRLTMRSCASAAQTATPTMTGKAIAILFIPTPRSTLDGGGGDLAALGLVDEVGGEGD